MTTGYIFISPNAGVAPSDSPALWKRADDTNQDKPVIEFADGVTENFDFLLAIPGDWASGGTLRFSWRGNSATTNAVRWSFQNLERANLEASDAAFANTDAANFANGAATANIVNIDTQVLTTTGWAANSLLYLRVQRIGADAGDTFAAAAQLLWAVLEFTTT
jgi:hypothetical protein